MTPLPSHMRHILKSPRSAKINSEDDHFSGQRSDALTRGSSKLIYGSIQNIIDNFTIPEGINNLDYVTYSLFLFKLCNLPMQLRISSLHSSTCTRTEKTYSLGGTQGSSTGLIFHISFAYSWIVRSLLNFGDPAVFKIDILVHLL